MLRSMRLEALILGAMLTVVPLYEAFIDQTRSVEDALLRYVVASVLCALALSIVSSIYYSYAAKIPRRRRGDSLLLQVEQVIEEHGGGVDLKDTPRFAEPISPVEARTTE